MKSKSLMKNKQTKIDYVFKSVNVKDSREKTRHQVQQNRKFSNLGQCFWVCSVSKEKQTEKFQYAVACQLFCLIVTAI